MARTEKLKKNKGIWALIIVLAALGFFVYIILYNGGVVVKKTDSTEVINKLKGIQAKGGEFQITQKDIDELSNLYFDKPISKGRVTLTGVNLEMLNDELLIKVPMSYNSYKKVNLLFSSKGKLNFSNGKITYAADYFKIGKLTIPKDFVISKISKFNNKIIYIEDNLIKINTRVFPFKINSFKIEDNKILGIAAKQGAEMSSEDPAKSNVEEIDKQLATMEQQIQGALVLMNEAQKSKATEILNTIEEVKGKSIEEKKKVIVDINLKIEKATSKNSESEKNEFAKMNIEVERV